MNIKTNLLIAALMTVVTTVLFGVVYPLVVTGAAQALFPDKANGQLLARNGTIVGSALLGQAFSSPATSTRVRRRPARGTTQRIPTPRTWDRRTRSWSMP
jgi:K+-transporting ATPase c subunit